MLLKSAQFSAHHSKYVRFQAVGRVMVNGKEMAKIQPQESTFIQGHTSDWIISRPKRLAWVKDVHPGDVLEVEVTKLELFLARKEFELRPLFAVAKSGSYQIALVAETETYDVISNVRYGKTAGLSILLMAIGWMVRRKIRHELSTARLLVLGAYALTAMPALDPRTASETIIPEEYFSDGFNIKAGFAMQFGLEILLGLEPLWQLFRKPTRAVFLIVPLLLSFYLLLAYHRLLHLQDYKDYADAYSDGLQRVGVYYIYSGNVTRVQLLVIGFPLLIQLLVPLFGGSPSPMPGLIFLTFRYFKNERFALAGFSTWDYYKQLAACLIGYIYLISVNYEQNSQISVMSSSSDHKEDPDELNALTFKQY
jgi:hypothetical protein